MSITVITPASALVSPISVNLLKQHLSMLPLETDWDQILDMYGSSAVDEFIAHTKKSILNEIVQQTFDCFPCESYFLLERGPVTAFDKIEYRDEDAVWVEFPEASYDVISNSVCPMVQLVGGKSWPDDIHPSMLASVRITYTTGYGTSDVTVPKSIKHILAMLIADSHLHRENSVIIPGATKIVVTSSSYSMMKKYYSNYYEHRSQSRR